MRLSTIPWLSRFKLISLQKARRPRQYYRPGFDVLEERRLLSVAPVLATIGNQSVTEGSTLIFRASATDEDADDVVSYSIGWYVDEELQTGLPSGVDFDSATGVFIWGPGEDQGPDEYTFEVIATDTFALEDSEEFTVTVDEQNLRPSILGTIWPFTYWTLPIPVSFGVGATEPANVSYQVYGSDADVPAQGLTFSFSETSETNSTGYFEWDVPASTAVGTYEVVFRVTDDGTGELFDEIMVPLNVSHADATPVGALVASDDSKTGRSVTTTSSRRELLKRHRWIIRGTSQIPGDRRASTCQGRPLVRVLLMDGRILSEVKQQRLQCILSKNQVTIPPETVLMTKATVLCYLCLGTVMTVVTGGCGDTSNDRRRITRHTEDLAAQIKGSPQSKEGRAAMKELIDILNGNSGFGQRRAADALGSLGTLAGPAVPDLMRAANSTDGFLEDAGVHALASLGPTAAPAVDLLIGKVEYAVSHDDYTVLGTLDAIRGLANIGAPALKAIPILERATTIKNELIASEAHKSLLRLKQLAETKAAKNKAEE